MFKKKKEQSTSNKDNKNELASMLGGLGMSPEDMQFGINMDENDDDDDDASLEAELAALQSEGRRNRNIRKPDDDDDDDDDDDLDNPELLAELQCIAPEEDVVSKHDPTPIMQPAKVQSSQGSASSSSIDLQQLSERQKMYQLAIANADKAGETSKARRYGRAAKQLEQMIKQCKSGKPVNLDEIPPVVSTESSSNSQPAASTAPAAPSTKIPELKAEVPPIVSHKPQPSKGKQVTKSCSAEQEQNLELLKTRQTHYKMAALNCKRSGDIAQAKHFLLVSKQIGTMIDNVSNNQPVDLSSLPPEPTVTAPADRAPQTEPRQQSASPTQEPQPGPSTQPTDQGPPPPPKDVKEALEQRLQRYQQATEKAKAEGNSSKARRMGRITKQYEDAIKAHKAGKPVDFEELPTPPGFEDVPLPSKPAAPQPSSQAPQQTQSQAPKLHIEIPKPAAAQPSSHSQGSLTRQGRNEQQLNFLSERQQEFKVAALKAKKAGDIDEAKQWLRMSKGLDHMIENASNGLRVDLTTVPPSPMSSQGPAPTASANFVMIETGDCIPNPTTPEEVTELYARLEDALIKQTEMCIKNGKHYQQLGDLNSAKMYEKMAKTLHQDLDSVKSARKHKEPPPRFHYENKAFTLVNSFPELSDSEVEIVVVRCLNIPLPSGYEPKDMYTYVTFEFPYPDPDEPQSGRGKTVKHSINPDFDESFKVNINRKNRTLARIFRRQTVKFEVKYERGFLKGDKALGQARVKLAAFDSKSEIHECIDLMDTERGRRAVGGKIEVRLKIREPLTDKDVQIENWKWLVIDMHIGGRKTPELKVDSITARTSPKPGKTVNQGSIDDLVSLEVLKMEKQLAERQISAQKSKGNSPSPSLVQRYKECCQKLNETQSMLNNADRKTLQSYVYQLTRQMKVEETNAQKALQTGNKTLAQLCLTRKELMQTEIISLKPKLGLK